MYSAVHGVMDTSKSMDDGMENNAIDVRCVSMSLSVLHYRNFLSRFKIFVRFATPRPEEQINKHSVHVSTSLVKHGRVDVHGFLLPLLLHKRLPSCFLQRVCLLGSGGSMAMMAIGVLIKDAFHLASIQRCVVHVTRELKVLLPKHSPLDATQALRTIALTLCAVRTEADRTVLFLSLIIWEQQYGGLLKQRTIPPVGSAVKRRWWYTHGHLRRAWRLLNLDPATLFAFLDTPGVPATNNSLEGVNRHLHRRVGMGKGKQLSLMLWKLALSRACTPVQKRQVWDLWKRRLYHS